MSITRLAEGGNEKALKYMADRCFKMPDMRQNRPQSKTEFSQSVMAKKKSSKRAATKRSTSKSSRIVAGAKKTKPRARIHAPRRLPPLTGLARDLYLQVLNKIAFQDYEECCLVETLAEKLGKTPGRLQPAIRKLVELGYVALEGEIYPVIYPTIEALRQQDPRLSEDDARRILANVRRA